MANANLFQQYLQPARSVLDYSNDFAKADQLRNANAMQALTLNQAANVQSQRNALRDLVQSGQTDLTTPAGQAQAISIAPDVAPGLVKSVQEGITGAAAAEKDRGAGAASNASAASTTFTTQQAKRDKAMNDIASFNSPQDALAALVGHMQAGDIDPVKAQSIATALQSIKDPGGFAQWQVGMLKGILTPKENLDLSAPKVEFQKAGDRLVPTQMNAYAPGGVSTDIAGLAPIKVGISPDAQLQSNTSISNNRANIAKDLTIAGLDANGNPTGNMGAMVDMLGNYQLDPKQALQRLTGPQRANIVSQVQAKYPGWDETTYDAKKGAAQKFTYGDQGNALRSVAVANNHLDQLSDLADAMNNGNVPVVNKVFNFFATQTGNPNVTNFDAIKNIVGQEVVKAIVAGGGSAGERDEAAKSFADASSPAQIKGAINHYRAVMAAQQAGLLSQRRAAGLTDSTLPDYSTPAKSAPAPAGGGWQYLGTAGGTP